MWQVPQKRKERHLVPLDLEDEIRCDRMSGSRKNAFFHGVPATAGCGQATECRLSREKPSNSGSQAMSCRRRACPSAHLGRYWINSRRFHSCGWPGSAILWSDMPLVTATSMSPDPVSSVSTKMSITNRSSGFLNRAWGGKTAEGLQPNKSP
jgi:hypothetical protein